MALEQNLVEHLHKYFVMRIFGHLKQLFADNQLSNFLITLETCHLCHRFLFKKQALVPNFVKDFRDIKKSTRYMRLNLNEIFLFFFMNWNNITLLPNFEKTTLFTIDLNMSFNGKDMNYHKL